MTLTLAQMNKPKHNFKPKKKKKSITTIPEESMNWKSTTPGKAKQSVGQVLWFFH